MQKVWKFSCDHEYAIGLFNRYQDNSNRNQEQGWIACDLQCIRESENAWFWLGWLVWMARNRLGYVSPPETASNLDFDLQLFCDFSHFCSAPSNTWQPLFSCVFLPYVMLSALGLQTWYKSPSINDFDVDFILPLNLSKFDSNHIFLYTYALIRVWRCASCPLKSIINKKSLVINIFDFMWFYLI